MKVLGTYTTEEISDYLARVIEFQLGRKAVNLLGISRFCPFEQPAVLLTSPYLKGQGIFPTTYWLSCPYLVKEVAHLEDGGLIKELTRQLKDNEGFRNQLMQSHQRYASYRYSLLDDREAQQLNEQSQNMYKVIKESGVGGIVEQWGIKCLHTHLADFLVAGDNPVGRIVWERIDWPDECEICERGVDED